MSRATILLLAVLTAIPATPQATHQFRVAVGLTDTAPNEWKGRVRVTGGEIAGAEGWRFSQADRVSPDGAFEFATKIGNLENQLANNGFPYGQTEFDDLPRIRRLIPQGVIVRARATDASRIVFDCTAGRIEFSAAQVGFHTPLTALGGNARVERMPIEEKLSEDGKADDYPAIAVTPAGARWIAWLSYGDAADTVVVSGAGRRHTITAPGDHHAPSIAIDGKGRVHVVYARNDGGVFQLHATTWDGTRWSAPPERLTQSGGSNIWPRLVSDGGDRLALVWQGFRDNRSAILVRVHDGSRWSRETLVSEGAGNAWAPDAAFGGGKLWIAWDSYATGEYQVYAREWTGRVVEHVSAAPGFSVRPSVAVTAIGAPVIAWEESEPHWGKDFALLAKTPGTTLYTTRRIRVAHRIGGAWREIGGPVAEALPVEIRRYAQQPQLALDGGRLYLGFRARTSVANARMDGWANNGRWETYLTALAGERWLPATVMPASIGRNGMRAALAIANGHAHIAWAADNRPWPAVRYGDLDILAASIPASAPPAQLQRGRAIRRQIVPLIPHPNESADTARIRSYRVAVGGKRYAIYRGDLHRHTELSNDGAGDGSLDDLYRYALDAARMDYAHVADHQMGNGEDYNWWLTQKSNDLYHMPGRFVVMYGYERSVPYPNGHRNVVWAERGKRVLGIGEAERKGGASTGPILYPYLRATGGIATSHTSATLQGTDWRDNDPAVEPLVEIYQGFESSYEHAGAPRAWKKGERAVHQAFQPLGYVWNAWAKGYKLGVQASSDHVATHTSYACILAENFTREGLLDAMRKRHAYAATDQIVVDFRVQTSAGVAIMGDIVQSTRAPKLMVKIIGTAAIKQIDVIRSNAYIHKVSPNRREASFEYVDASQPSGESFYYVRVEQVDGELAWSSPVWVRR